MTDAFLTAVERAFPLREREVGDYAVMKGKGMTFRLRCFDAAGLGSVSVLRASGMLGLMKMDTFIVNPFYRDAPLFSYDRVLAAGNDTLLCELYDTLLAPLDLSAVTAAAAPLTGQYDHDLGRHWYDPIKLAQSIAKKGKRGQSTAFDALARDYVQAYLSAAQSAPVCGEGQKRDKGDTYVEGLLSHGGPSTDAFKSFLGAEKTGELFRRYIFATLR